MPPKSQNSHATATPPHQPPNLCQTLVPRYRFAITLRQIAKHLKINQERILNWEKYSLRCVRLRLWHNVLWVHIQGLGGYFISYRKLEQWIAACRTLIRFCPTLEALNALWSLILQEAQRYAEEAFSRLEASWQQRQTDLCDRQQI
jgi:hypothetical protein